MPNKPVKQIALLIESSGAYGRGLIEGISSYSAEKEDWQLIYQEATRNHAIDEWLTHWQGDGIIARINTMKEADAIVASGIPCVDVLGHVSHPDIISVDSDHQIICELAMDFFLKAGFSNFAYCGYPGNTISDLRQQAFADSGKKFGGRPPINYGGSESDANLLYKESWNHDRLIPLGAWITDLPKPVALLAYNDIRAFDVSAACRLSGVNVPSEVAILGIDNDKIICNMAHPPLSSIQPDLIKLGQLAVQALDQLMQKVLKTPQPKTEIAPIQVIERASTDVVVSSHPHVIAAIRFIRNHLSEASSAAQVAQCVNVSRSLLDRDFKTDLGYSISQEIHRIRLARAIHELKYGTLTLDNIAEKIGLADAASLAHFIKKNYGISAGKIRESEI